MYKKLIAAVLSLALVFCTGVPAFAAAAETEISAVEIQDAEFAAVSEDPFMPYGTPVTECTPPADEAPGEEILEGDTEAEAGDTETGDAETAEAEDEEDSGDEDQKTSDDEDEDNDPEKQAAIKYRNGLAAYMRSKNPKMGKIWSRNLAQTFIDIADKYNLDPTVLMALAQYESTFSSKATSRYGYKGIMQTSDWLAKSYGYKPKDLYDPAVSIDVAARYLRSLKKSFGTYTMALCGYMYGGSAVKKGSYSKKGAWRVMNIREEIKDYLEKKNFV